MGYITDFQYYQNGGNIPTNENWGSYQYVSLNDIVTNFELMYVGNDKLINNVERYNILFHAKRAIQELNYDALRNVKILELTISDTLQMVLPPDYVNYVRISFEKDGVLFPMIENKQTNYSNSYLQDNNLDIVFDIFGNVVETASKLDMDRLLGQTQRIYLGDGKYNGQYGWFVDGDWYFTRQVGGIFGSDPETSNGNVTFRIDNKSGVINFSSVIPNENVVLEYISDGMEKGDDGEISINKLAEEAVYAYMKWAILDNKFGVQEYVVNRARREKTAKLRNAKIRLSNLHPSRLLMVLRNQSKWIK
jgi:hypothetical protein